MSRVHNLVTYFKELHVSPFEKAVFHPDKVEHGVGRKVTYMYLAQGTAVQVFLNDKLVDKGDANVFHNHFLYSVDCSDYYIRLEGIDILSMRMQYPGQVSV